MSVILNANAAPALQAVIDLFDHLNAEGIRYCHWKSNCRLALALAGRTDLDLLIDRADSRRFKEILYQHDFKPFVSSPRRQFPAIEDYLGFDRETGRLIHLHIHYRLILGEEYVKNYYLPLERSFLASSELRMGVRVPAPELELIVLSLRALLKYRTSDALRDLLGIGRRGGLPRSTLDEIDDLLALTNPERLARALHDHAGLITPEVIVQFLATIRQAPRSGRTLYELRRRVRRELAPYQRYSRLRARLIASRAMLERQWPFDRVLRRLLPAGGKQKIPASGGLTVAFVGADGAGKSTIIEHVVKWLSWRTIVRTYYMGNSQPSPGTRAVKSLAKAARMIHAVSRRVFGGSSVLERQAGSARRFFESLRYIADGRDRYRRALAGRRKANQGAIVIFDRYPLRGVRVANRELDGPRIATVHSGHAGSFMARLARAEERLYQRIPPPEHLFILRVSPAVSQERKPDHRRETIEAKSQAMEQIEADGFGSTHIDADLPLDQVLLEIKTALWRLL